ncbi:hypothetical protein ABRZ04_10485 [Castellaniella ginsengisoli]|uniref:Pepco domain-containing protein n=1 Tax=Castellaniella ginsengisoli TaxID=546114 RepID=A0AB39CY10_9BURK
MATTKKIATVAKTAVKKASAKKAPAKLVAQAYKAAPAKKSAAKKAHYGVSEPGYKKTPGGVLAPVSHKKTSASAPPESVVPVGKIEKGLKDALVNVNKVLSDSINSVAEGIQESVELERIELSLSFNAEGKFIGIGVGGAATIKVCLRPAT